MVKEWCKRISEQIGNNKEEKEIIEYGLNQFFWILINFFSIIIGGYIWKEFRFSVLVFLGVYFMRPYVGGYHADTEIRCYIFSVGIVNVAIMMRKFIQLSWGVMLGVYIYFIAVIILFSPLDNPIHLLNKEDREYYRNISGKLVLLYSFLLVVSEILKIKILKDAIIYTVIIVGTSVLVGKWKYKK